MSLRNTALFGGWISVARMVYKRDKLIKRKSLPPRFNDWMYEEFKIKKQKTYNYNKSLSVDEHCSKVVELSRNMRYFVKNPEILMTYFKSKEQIVWKHQYDCTSEDCNSYFFEINAIPSGMEY